MVKENKTKLSGFHYAYECPSPHPSDNNGGLVTVAWGERFGDVVDKLVAGRLRVSEGESRGRYHSHAIFQCLHTYAQPKTLTLMKTMMSADNKFKVWIHWILTKIYVDRESFSLFMSCCLNLTVICRSAPGESWGMPGLWGITPIVKVCASLRVSG